MSVLNGEDHGRLLFSSRMVYDSRDWRIALSILLFLPLIPVVWMVTAYLDGSIRWYLTVTLSALAALLLLPTVLVRSYPPFKVYQRGFTKYPRMRIPSRGGVVIPFERVTRISMESEGGNIDPRSLAIGYDDGTGGEVVYRPLSKGSFAWDDVLKLLHVLAERVPERVDSSITRHLGPGLILSFLRDDSTGTGVPVYLIDDMGGLRYLWPPLILFFIGFGVSAFGSELEHLPESGTGTSTFTTWGALVMSLLLISISLRIGVIHSIKLRLALHSTVVGENIKVVSDPLDRWFYRVVDPLPLSAIESVRLRVTPPPCKRYLGTRFSNGEEYVLPREVLRQVEGGLVPGEDPCEMRNSMGGEELGGPVIRVSWWRLLLFSLLCLLVFVVSLQVST